MTEDRELRLADDPADRPEPAADLADADLDAVYDPDATRPIQRRTTEDSIEAQEHPVATRSRRVNPGSEWFWPVVNLIGIGIVILVNWLANAFPFNGQSTGDVLDASPVWFQPAEWAFLIWGLIFLLLLAFAIFGLLPAGRRNPWLRRISPFFLIANIANAIWLFFWHWEQFGATLVTMAILLLSLVAIYTILHWRRKDEREAHGGERLFVWPVFSIYLGWISVAALANLAVYLDRDGWDGGPFSLRMWSVFMLIAGGIVCAFMAFVRRDGLYPLVFAFASVAIAVEQWDRSRLVSTVAIVIAVIEAILVVVAILMAFDRRAMTGIYSRRRNEPEMSIPE